MKYELKRVDPLRAANVGALVYGLVLGAFALIALPFFLFASALAPSDEFGAAGPAFIIFLVMLYPFMGLVMGWIGGLLTSAIYNFIITMSGGLLFEFDNTAVDASDGAAS